MAYCGNCGSEMPEGVKYCINCGTNVLILGVEKEVANNAVVDTRLRTDSDQIQMSDTTKEEKQKKDKAFFLELNGETRHFCVI